MPGFIYDFLGKNSYSSAMFIFPQLSLNQFSFEQNITFSFFIKKNNLFFFTFFPLKKGFIVPWESTNKLKRRGLMIQCDCDKKYRLGVAAYNKFKSLECLMIFVRPVIFEPDMDHDLYKYVSTPRRFRNILSSIPSKKFIRKRNIKKEINIVEPIASTSTTDQSMTMCSSQLQFNGSQAETSPNGNVFNSPNYETQSIDMNNNSDQYVDLNREILVQTFTQPIEMDFTSEQNPNGVIVETSIENSTNPSPINQSPVHNELDVPESQ